MRYLLNIEFLLYILSAGFQGRVGTGGDPGSDGTKGTVGEKGAPVPPGGLGDSGDTGDVGLIGRPGLKGAKGVTGRLLNIWCTVCLDKWKNVRMYSGHFILFWTPSIMETLCPELLLKNEKG